MTAEHTNKYGVKYKVVDGTYYHAETPDPVVKVLEAARKSRRAGQGQRIRIRYGTTEASTSDSDIGRDWLEEHDCEGYVGRSMGPEKIPILLYNSRSMGGGAMLDNCIVRIIDTRTKRVLYSHPQYHRPELTIQYDPKENGYNLPFAVHANDTLHARFTTQSKAERWVQKMSL